MSVTSMLTKRATFTYKVLVGSDEYGQPVYSALETEVQCYYRFMQSSTLDSTYIENSEVQVFLHPGTQTEDLGIVTIDGLDYVPAGVPESEYNPRTGLVSHLVLTVRRGES